MSEKSKINSEGSPKASRLRQCLSASFKGNIPHQLACSIFCFFIKEHFPHGTEKNVTYRLIDMRGKNTLSTTKTPAYKPGAFAALFSLLWEPQCLCTKPSTDIQDGDTVGAGIFLSPAAVAGL